MIYIRTEKVQVFENIFNKLFNKRIGDNLVEEYKKFFLCNNILIILRKIYNYNFLTNEIIILIYSSSIN